MLRLPEIKEDLDGASCQHQRGGVQRPPQSVPDLGRDVEVDGEALLAVFASTGRRTTRPAWRSPRACAAQIRGTAQASRNAQDGISLVQTAEGSLNEMHSILQRVRELSVQCANGTLSTSDQAKITAEVAQLTAELVRIRDSSKFNGIALFSAGAATTVTHPGRRQRQRGRREQRQSRRHLDRPDRLHGASSMDVADDRHRPRPACRTCAPTSARCRTGSSTPSRTSACSQENLRPPRAASATWTWPRRW